MLPTQITTRLTGQFGLTTPLVLAPMALASGGELAAACCLAGAIGLIGGAYGDLDWTTREYQIAVNRLAASPAAQNRLGCGFITWKLDENPAALDAILDHPTPPRAIMLSFGDPRPYAARIAAANAKLICQIQRIDQIPPAIDAGAAIIVAQGGEAGGHGVKSSLARSSFTLVPETADFLAKHAPQTLLLAAGGIADGRGLAAALMLGADGALVGSRLWATRESLAPDASKHHILPLTGDNTARSAIFDILRRKNWPEPYDFRAVRNALHRQWENRIEELTQNPAPARAQYDDGVRQQDYHRAHATVGESVGLIGDLPTAGEWIASATAQARELLRQKTLLF